MGLLWRSGAESQSVTANVEGGDIVDTGFAVSTTTVRSGLASFRANASASQPGFDSSITSSNFVYVRTCVNIASLPASNALITEVYNNGGNKDVGVCVTSTGNFVLFARSAAGAGTTIGTSAVAYATNTWYVLEYKVDMSANPWNVELRVDGTSVVSSTFTAAASTVNVYSIGCAALTIATMTFANTTMDIYYDDMGVNDTTGSFQNTWLGSSKIIHLRTARAGDVNTFATQTGGTAGAGNNYTRTSEITPDDATSFNGSSTLNEEDLMGVDSSDMNGAGSINANDTINCVLVGGRFRNSTADSTGVLKFEIQQKASGTVLQSAAIIPNSTTFRTNAVAVPRVHPIITYQDTTSVNWSKKTLETIQVGYKLTTGPGTAGRRCDVSTVWVLVDYTPATRPATLLNNYQIARVADNGNAVISVGR